jgi:hypothetical protein
MVTLRFDGNQLDTGKRIHRQHVERQAMIEKPRSALRQLDAAAGDFLLRIA